MTDEDRQALFSVWNSHGGLILRSMLAEQAQVPKDELWEIMARKPDTLTGKTALKYAIKAKALNDFAESVEDAVRPLNPQGQGK